MSPKKKLRYKLHQTIDADHRVIIDCHITTGSVPDGNVYADRLKDNGINSYVPRFHKDVGEKNDREKTPYDVEKNEFRCELGNRLEQRGQEKKSGYLFYRPVKGAVFALTLSTKFNMRPKSKRKPITSCQK